MRAKSKFHANQNVINSWLMPRRRGSVGYIYNENDTTARRRRLIHNNSNYTAKQRETQERTNEQNGTQMTSVKLAREYQHVVARPLTKSKNNNSSK